MPLGVACGLVISAAISVFEIVPTEQGHAVLVAAIATPYLVFALLDGSARALALETLVIVAFVTLAFLVLNASALVVASLLAAHALWDVAHLRLSITKCLGDYPAWCAALDVTAAVSLVAHEYVLT